MSAEKRSLQKFIVLYFSATFILLAIIFVLIWHNRITMLYTLERAKMQNLSFQIASKVINAQMQSTKLDLKSLHNSSYKFALYDKNSTKICGDTIDNKGFILVDKTPLGHLGVDSVVVENPTIDDKIDAIAKELILGFILSYIFIAMVGYYLSKLFMRPVKEARAKLDRFIKDTTHELNTPITAIMMCANKEALQNPKNINRLLLSARRVSELYRDLTYLFLEERRKRKEKLKLASIIKEQLAYFELLAQKKQLTIQCSLDDTTVFMDREDFVRLFSNLLSNAIKYNVRGGLVDIHLEKGVLRVKDSGIGIEKEKLASIFKRYQRATTQSGGFGIGLSIVESIVKENNLKLLVEPRENGTIFIVDFSTQQLHTK